MGPTAIEDTGKPIESRFTAEKGRVRIILAADAIVKAGEAMEVEIA